MPRVKKPNVEQQEHDRLVVAALATVIDAVIVRYPTSYDLNAAQRGLHGFGARKVEPPKPRVRKPKAAPAFGGEAAANG